MAGEWKETTLADVAVDMSYGYTESAADDKVGPKFLRITDIQGGVVDWSSVPYCRITPEEHCKYKLADGDIVVARTGNSTGENYLYRGDEDAVFASYLIRFRLDRSRVNPRFVWYNLRTSRWWGFINSSKTGSAQAGANARVLGRFPLRLPPLRQQQAIAHILGTLDDKIELNRRMNRTLEDMARAVFKSWFVDFEPVRAKAAVRREHPDWSNEQVSRAACPNLKPEIAALFPDSFEDSELGVIPRGWRVGSLDNIARFLNGLAMQKYPPVGDHSLPVIKIAQLRMGHSVGADRASADLPAEYVVNDGDVLFSWSGSLECRLWAGGPGALNQHLFKVTSESYPRWLCYLGIHAHLDDFRHIASGKATTMGHIQRHHLSEAKLPIPPSELLGAMDGVMAPMIESTWRYAVESRTLAAIRDTLLPKLISGELRVPDAERIVERAIDAGGASVAATPTVRAAEDQTGPSPNGQPPRNRQEPDEDEPEARPTIDDYAREDVLAVIRELYRDDPASCDREELLVLLREKLGFGVLGRRIRKYLEGDLLAAVRRGVLERCDGEYRIYCRTIEDYERDWLKELFLQAIGRGWIERDEAMQQAARYLGFQRTGSRIKGTFKSLINSLIREGRVETEGSAIRRL